MSSISKQQYISDYLSRGKLMQLATSSDDVPHACTISYAHDTNGNLYWMSARNTQHSIDLKSNQNAAVAIVPNPIKKVGIQLIGTAQAATGEQLEYAYSIYGERYGNKYEHLNEALDTSSDELRTYYVFTPHTVKVYDEVNFPTDPVHVIA